MKKVQLRVFKSFNSLIALLLTVLGFSTSCDKVDPKVEYGTPHATFIVKGQVQSKSDAKPLSNIQVVLNFNDTTYSDTNGKYVLEQSTFPNSQNFKIQFKDIDGLANQEFNSLDSIVEFKDPKFSGGSGNWDKGSTETEFNVKLKQK